MASKVFDEGKLKRYLDGIEAAPRHRAARLDQIINNLRAAEKRINTLTEAISEVMGTVNQMRRRRHNSISVSWRIEHDKLPGSLSQPMGPVWNQLRIGNNGRRYISRIPKLTLQYIKNSYQGKDAGELKRAYKKIKNMTGERDYLIGVLVRVMRAQQYLNPKKATKRKS